MRKEGIKAAGKRICVHAAGDQEAYKSSLIQSPMRQWTRFKELKDLEKGFAARIGRGRLQSAHFRMKQILLN